MPASSRIDENWTKSTDAGERRRIQNRLAQRNYRNNIKQRLRQLEQLDKAFSKSVTLNATTLTRDQNDEEDVLQQQQNTPTYPVSQSDWVSSQNEISMSGHTEIQMDMTSRIEPSPYMYGLNSPQPYRLPSPSRPQHQQYNYFSLPVNASSPEEPHPGLTYDREASGEITPTTVSPQLQYHSRHASAGSKSDAATQSGFSSGVGFGPTPIQSSHGNTHSQPISHSHAHSQPQAFGAVTPPISEKGDKLNATKLQSPASQSRKNTIKNHPGPLPYPVGPANPEGGTPLHQAAANGHVHIVRFLVLKGANLTAPNEAGRTVLHLAAERGHEVVIEHVLSQGQGAGGGGDKAFIDAVDDQGFTALHRAAAGGHEECVRLLVEAGAQIESSGRISDANSPMFRRP